MVAAHRQERPWSGESRGAPIAPPPQYLPDCYLCPGNPRVSGMVNPLYEGIYVFDNDHPCVSSAAPPEPPKPAGIYRSLPAQGIARVVCYHPRHNATLAEMSTRRIEALLRTWQQQYRELGAHAEINHVLVFENKGEVIGVSNPHPHGQIYATNFVFKTIEIELEACQEHLYQTGRILFQDILDAERGDGRRILTENDSAIAFVPYFARYAYETYVAPKTTWPSLAALPDDQVADLAQTLKTVLVCYDNLWNLSFPYVMALHQAPTDGRSHEYFHFHIQLHPPLRKPNLLKYLAGPEVGGGCFLSDTAPEEKAAELRATSPLHYRQAQDGGCLD
jgi:UDPglucose--hexose-1-phosphate uridylyltransferase